MRLDGSPPSNGALCLEPAGTRHRREMSVQPAESTTGIAGTLASGRRWRPSHAPEKSCTPSSQSSAFRFILHISFALPIANERICRWAWMTTHIIRETSAGAVGFDFGSWDTTAGPGPSPGRSSWIILGHRHAASSMGGISANTDWGRLIWINQTSPHLRRHGMELHAPRRITITHQHFYRQRFNIAGDGHLRRHPNRCLKRHSAPHVCGPRVSIPQPHPARHWRDYGGAAPFWHGPYF